MPYIFDQFGRSRAIGNILAVERLEKLKEKSGSDPWPVIEECFKVWSSKNPTKWKSYLYYLDDIKKTRKDKKFASTTDKVTGGILRYTIDFPEHVMQMIRCLYTATELPMNKEFFRLFAKKFPAFTIAEKL